VSPLAENLALIFRRPPTSLLSRGLIALISFSAATAMGSTVNFWLSNSLPEPVAPTFAVPAGAIFSIDIWVRPPAGATLSGFSLNLASEQAGAIEFTVVRVHNPVYASENHRHQFVYDSDTQLLEGVTYNDLFLGSNFIEKFVGMTLFPGANGTTNGQGIGPDCDTTDTMYCSASSGGPAWRIATVAFEAVATGTTRLYLEIGQQGFLLDGEDPPDTGAIFGADDVVRTWSAAAYPDLPQDHTGWVLASTLCTAR
jgi:hypothetical protein